MFIILSFFPLKHIVPNIWPSTLQGLSGYDYSLTCCSVHEAIIWGVFHIHQFIFGCIFEVFVCSHKPCAILVCRDLYCHVVLLLQVVSCAPEIRHSEPACTQSAGATDPMTLAFELHEPLHCLRTIMLDQQHKARTDIIFKSESHLYYYGPLDSLWII